MRGNYISGSLTTEAGDIPIVSTAWGSAERFGAIKVRFAIGRGSYKVEPGLYAIGNPTAKSLVFVSANYKLSFDILRRNLDGLDAWIMVLDTKGINVWCAAGKGTFGTAEIIERIVAGRLDAIVNHRKISLPQLGATGVAAHEIRKATGFTVIYGPIRASDIRAFLEADMKATPEMRQVKFTFLNRLVLVPVEFVIGGKYLLLSMVVFFILAGWSSRGFSIDTATKAGVPAIMLLLIAFCGGTIAGPLLLPWLPGRSFSAKGFFVGAILWGFVFIFNVTGNSVLEAIAWALMIPAISSFVTMNFTGASTYTSLSGVKKEMRVAVPLQFGFAVIGFGLWTATRFI